MNEEKNTAQRTAEELLEQPISIVLGGTTYQVPRPTRGTIMRISAEISMLPKLPKVDDGKPEQYVQAVLAVADKCGYLSRILAIAILGDGNLVEEHAVRVRVPLSGFLGKIGLKRSVITTEKIYKDERLAYTISTTATAGQTYTALTTILNNSDIPDFFASIAFLDGVNLMRMATTTAHGQSLQECARPSA